MTTKRYNPNYDHDCYGMVEEIEGDYVLWEDYLNQLYIITELIDGLVRCRQQASCMIGGVDDLSGQMHKIRSIVNETLSSYRTGGNV